MFKPFSRSIKFASLVITRTRHSFNQFTLMLDLTNDGYELELNGTKVSFKILRSHGQRNLVGGFEIFFQFNIIVFKISI